MGTPANVSPRYEPLLQSTIDPKAALEFAHTSRRGRRSKQFPTLDIAAIALKLGCNKAHVSRILNGKRIPSFILGNRLCKLLNISLEQLEHLCNPEVIEMDDVTAHMPVPVQAQVPVITPATTPDLNA